MIQEPSNTRIFNLQVEVDIDKLTDAYTGGDTSIQVYDLPPIEEIIEFEMGWVGSSGIHINEIKEVKE